MSVGPLVRCPDCGCDRQVHFADLDRDEWGCYACDHCQAGYEIVGDLIAGRLRSEGNIQLDAITDEAERRMGLGMDTHIPMGRAADLSALPTADLGDVELADNLILGALAMETNLGRIPALLFRFAVAGPRPHRFPDRVFVIPSLKILDGLEQLVGDALANARKVLGA